MSFAEFAESVKRESAPPAGASEALAALWHDAKGDWARAHELAEIYGDRFEPPASLVERAEREETYSDAELLVGSA